MKKAMINRKRNVVVVMLLLLPLVMLATLQVGYSDFTISEFFEVLVGKGTQEAQLVFLSFRLPRTVIAVLVGIGFAVSGCILQGLTGNPLADPGIIGINAGAGLIVLLFIVGVGTLGFSSFLLMPFFALIGASIAGITIYKLSTHPFKGLMGNRLVLNGIALQAGINAAMMLIILKMDKDQHDFLATWQAGSIWNAHWKLVIALVPWIVIGFGLAMYLSKDLDILALGEDTARAIGLKVKASKRHLLILSIALAASSVSVSGSMSFVGLLSPHIARKLVGNKHNYLIPASAMTGALLMLVADVIGRKIAEPSEIPTGIVVAAVGAPYFLYLLVRAGKKG